MAKKKDRTGEVKINNQGLKMIIKKYNSYTDLDIEFESGYIAKGIKYNNFEKGEVRDKFSPQVCGVGYIGETKTCNRGEHTKSYFVWNSMIHRCYDEKFLKHNKAYERAEVCKEWLCYSNFCEWFKENYYEIENEKVELDKDILNKGNKIYSPKTCIFVPKRINQLFPKCDKSRGDLPIGVSFEKGAYTAGIMKKRKKCHLGRFKTIEEAFEVYKKTKEEYIKEVAEEYKERIPSKLYEAMYSYEVEITD